MSDQTAMPRARYTQLFRHPWERKLGHPVAYVLTVVILLALFGGTFVANPDRIAPTKDPAYYTWRTEMLMSEPPVRLLETEGAFGMFAGGYRVTAPIIGGFLRHVAGIGTLTTTTLLMVVLPVLTALLLAGFAYRHRPEPLLWHSVALGSASLFLTPPFVGYLDNLLCLFFLAAALSLLGVARERWSGRIGFGMFLVLAGLTHPTTLVIFCVVLGLIAAARFVLTRWDLAGVVRRDGPVLATAFASVIVTYLIWKLGVWGREASLAEAALPPPYGSDFFVARMKLWVDAMNPILNGPLFLLGLVGTFVTARRLADDDLALVSVLWLAPLVGLFGFLAGLTYPYYRFFNTTLAWVLLVGAGIYFAARFFIDQSARGGIARWSLVGLVALGVIIAANFATGFDKTGWNDAARGWLSAAERTELEVVRTELARPANRDRPVVFVIDDEPPEPFQIWGYTKLSGNTSRFGLPHGMIDQAYLYLGPLDDYLNGVPSPRGEETYDKLTRALLEDARDGIERSGKPPITVVLSSFNSKGANADLPDDLGLPSVDTGAEGVVVPEEIWLVRGNEVHKIGSGGTSPGVVVNERAGKSSSSGPLHLLRVLFGLALLLLPGGIALRWFLPGASFAESLGMVPALSVALLTSIGFIVLAVTRGPFSIGLAIVCLILTIAAAVAGVVLGRRAAGTPGPEPAIP